ncbi:ABC transporter ATP-binding protein [Paenibacillus radicis (ex Gao et al. 2016)]|uniref:Nickel import system ATP-binding protein NikD n=1 Tax=Paenibacillus radicis (ex Gao et al. 2016) TaxID=1737354 RepID=A0A917HEW8_9BACL|nr:ABC transporter ATP-binding protein [Paenibacillus radicis (ex Gao et al. 2016)]GGG77440.1 ABC transporter ATP-binding protein [Paenibacillus radicis (ex Gao et al. 2016)]
MALLEVEGLTVAFRRQAGLFRQRTMEVIHGLELTVDAGQVVAVVGSSGSGKSLLAHAIMGLLPDNAHCSGSIRYDGTLLDAARVSELRGKEIAIVPQSVTYLDPLIRVGKQVRHAASAGGGEGERLQKQVFARNGLAEETARMYPHELSGGMARRVLASTAIISGAKLIVADEPTPGLNEAAALETARQFRELADAGCAVLFITHDIQLALSFADRIVVLYAGTVMENAAAADFAGDGERLRHPYTKALWQALPGNGFKPLGGSQPHPDMLPPGCLFAPRCCHASEDCTSQRPEFMPLRDGAVRCFHAS